MDVVTPTSHIVHLPERIIPTVVRPNEDESAGGNCSFDSHQATDHNAEIGCDQHLALGGSVCEGEPDRPSRPDDPEERLIRCGVEREPGCVVASDQCPSHTRSQGANHDIGAHRIEYLNPTG